MTDIRLAALSLAIQLHGELEPDRRHHDDEVADQVLRTARRFARFLGRPTSLHITFGRVVNQTSGQPTDTPSGGNPMQIHDDEQFSLTVEAKDAKGVVVADELTWTAATLDDGDASTIVTLEVSDDTQTCVVKAGVPGSVVITVSDDEGLSATEAVDVVPGGVATISIAEGTVTKQ